MGSEPQYDFEWDREKARKNLAKHGIGFEEAAEVFLDPHAVSLLDREHADREARWITLGAKSPSSLLVVIHTFEEVGSRYRVRIISARKATSRERRAHEEGR